MLFLCQICGRLLLVTSSHDTWRPCSAVPCVGFAHRGPPNLHHLGPLCLETRPKSSEFNGVLGIETVLVVRWERVNSEGGTQLFGPTILLPPSLSTNTTLGATNWQVQCRQTHQELLETLGGFQQVPLTLCHNLPRKPWNSDLTGSSNLFHHGHPPRPHGRADAQSRHHDTAARHQRGHERYVGRARPVGLRLEGRA